MKKYYLLLPLIVFLFSCNKNQKLETISLFNDLIYNMDDIYQLNRMIGKAPILFHNENTKKSYRSDSAVSIAVRDYF